MSMDQDEKARLEKIETALFGNGERDGVLARITGIELQLEHLSDHAKSISDTLSKLMWIVITAVIVAVLGMILHRPITGSSTSQNVNVSSAKTSDVAEIGKAQGYYTTDQYAQLVGKSARTVIDWINSNQLTPKPTQHGREWRLDLTTKPLSDPPLFTANSGN